MGTTTTNYNFYKPDIGETDWGATFNSQTLDAIDTAIKSVSDSIVAENLWDRTAGVLVPHTANDPVNLGSGNFSTTGTITDGTLSITAGVMTGVVTINGNSPADWNAAVAHITADGSSHSDVVLNSAHRTGDGSDHSDVVLNSAHRTGDGSDHADVATNSAHVGTLHNYAFITGNDAATDVTAGELETLTDGSDVGGLHTHSGLGGDLDDAYNNGRTITVDAGPVVLDVTGTETGLELNNDGTGYGAHIHQDGVLAAGKNALYVYSDAAQTNAHLAWFYQDNASSDKRAVHIRNDGTGQSLGIYQVGDAAHINFTGDPANSSPVDGDLWYTGSALNFYDGASTTNLLLGGGGGVSNLQEAFDGGQTITIADTDNQTLTITNNDTTNNPGTVQITNAGTGQALRIDQDGNATAAFISNAGTGIGFYINQEGVLAANKEALRIYSNAVQVNSPLVLFKQENASSTADVMDIDNDGTGHGLYIQQDGVLASGKHGLYVYSNTAQTTTDYLVKFYSQEGSGSNTAGVLYVHNNAKGYSLNILSEAGAGRAVSITNTGTGEGIYIDNNSTNHGIHINQDGVLAASDYALYVHSNSAQVNSPLVFLHQDNASSTDRLLELSNDGTGHALYVYQNTETAATEHIAFIYSGVAQTNSALAKIWANHASTTQPCLDLLHSGDGAHINLSGDPTNSSPTDGDLWYNGTNLNFYDGSNTTDLLAGGASSGAAGATFANGDLTAGVLTVNHALGTKVCTVMVADNNDEAVVPDDITFTDTNNLDIDLSSYGTIAGTWRYFIVGESTGINPTPWKTATLSYVIDGGGIVIGTGVVGDLDVPFDCTINQVTMLADQTGSIAVDIWKDTYANYPPTNADSITAAAVPTISAAIKDQDSTLTGWTTSISAGDTLRFNVDSCSTITRCTISLKVTRT